MVGIDVGARAGPEEPDTRPILSIADLPRQARARDWVEVLGRIDYSPARHAYVLRPGWPALSEPSPPPAQPARLQAGPHSPARLADFVGQREIVGDLIAQARDARRRGAPMDPFLLAGPPGLGKTSLARLVAEELGVRLHCAAPRAIATPVHLLGLLFGLRARDVLLIDEIHGLSAPCQDILLTAMEGGYVDIVLVQGARSRTMRLLLEPFTLAGATTDPGDLAEALYDRFPTRATLTYYEVEDLEAIIARAAARIGMPIDPKAARELARRSRGTPRDAIRLLRRTGVTARNAGASRIALEHAVRAAAAQGIDARGLGREERALLRVLLEEKRPIGIETLSRQAALDPKRARRIHEPFLLRAGYVRCTRHGRTATQKARALEGSLLGDDAGDRPFAPP